MKIDRSSKWVVRYRPSEGAKLRLFCFPYAGGSASVFRRWPEHLPPEIEVCAIQLPGREDRFGEPFCEDLSKLIPLLAEKIRPFLDRPFAMFGHSMGALIAFCLARHLRSEGAPSPALLALSARQAAHLVSQRRPVSKLTDEAFVQELNFYGATPREVLEHPELRAMFLSVLRADFSLFESYHHTQEAPLTCPISAFAAVDDHTLSVDQVSAWREHASGPFTFRQMTGGHFFLNTATAALLTALAGDLRAVRT